MGSLLSGPSTTFTTDTISENRIVFKRRSWWFLPFTAAVTTTCLLVGWGRWRTHSKNKRGESPKQSEPDCGKLTPPTTIINSVLYHSVVAKPVWASQTSTERSKLCTFPWLRCSRERWGACGKMESLKSHTCLVPNSGAHSHNVRHVNRNLTSTNTQSHQRFHLNTDPY